MPKLRNKKDYDGKMIGVDKETHKKAKIQAAKEGRSLREHFRVLVEAEEGRTNG